ncbi:hypothetical protein D3C72_1965230 [compost metagenome]
MAQVQQLLVERLPGRVRIVGHLRARVAVGGRGVRVGNCRPLPGVSVGLESGKLGPASFAHGIGQGIVVVGKEQERLLAAPFFAHEQQRDHR